MSTNEKISSAEEKILKATIEALDKSLKIMFQRDGIPIDSTSMGLVMLLPNDKSIAWYTQKITTHVSPFIEGATNQVKAKNEKEK